MTDADLLHAIAKQRSQPAFTELYRRYESAAYNLAVSISGKSVLAEEAVQNALLRIWKSAATFQSGNARGWVLCVVARESLKQIKAQHREQKKNMNVDDVSVRSPDAAAPERIEQAEMVAALRVALRRLPELDRQLVTLYFVGGLSHDEISRELSTPRQTVTRHIQNALQVLRSNLTASGFAAAVPLLGAEGFSSACCSGHAVPPGLRAKVLSELARPHVLSASAQQASKRLSRRVLVSKSGSLGLAASVVVVFAAAVGAWAYWPAPKPIAATRVNAAPAVPTWQPVMDDYHDVLGQAKGKWVTEKSPQGLGLTFTPDPKEAGIEKSYCYVGHNFNTSQEIRGTLDYVGSGQLGYAELCICLPNRFNCRSYAVPFKRSVNPMQFRIQARFNKKGCRFAISLVDSDGREHAEMSKVDEWLPPPWTRTSKNWDTNQSPLSTNGKIVWPQSAYADLRECGFGFVVNDGVKIRDLQIRPLVDSEWVADPDEVSETVTK